MFKQYFKCSSLYQNLKISLFFLSLHASLLPLFPTFSDMATVFCWHTFNTLNRTYCTGVAVKRGKKVLSDTFPASCQKSGRKKVSSNFQETLNLVQLFNSLSRYVDEKPFSELTVLQCLLQYSTMRWYDEWTENGLLYIQYFLWLKYVDDLLHYMACLFQYSASFFKWEMRLFLVFNYCLLLNCLLTVYSEIRCFKSKSWNGYIRPDIVFQLESLSPYCLPVILVSCEHIREMYANSQLQIWYKLVVLLEFELSSWASGLDVEHWLLFSYELT